MNLSHTFLNHFEHLDDPRKDTHNRRHNLIDILVMTILGTICGADTWVEIQEFSGSKYDGSRLF
jgi:hypothetical protein